MNETWSKIGSIWTPKWSIVGSKAGSEPVAPSGSGFGDRLGRSESRFGIHLGSISASVWGCFPDRFFGGRSGASGILGRRLGRGWGEVQERLGRGSGAIEGADPLSGWPLGSAQIKEGMRNETRTADLARLEPGARRISRANASILIVNATILIVLTIGLRSHDPKSHHVCGYKPLGEIGRAHV